MNGNLDNECDGKLSQLLREWRIETPLPPGFEQGVWRRIERDRPRPGLWSRLADWMGMTFTRPAVAAAYLSFFLLAGGGAGYWQAQDRSQKAEARWRALYIESVDPYQIPRNSI